MVKHRDADLDAVFSAVSHPIRRAMLEQLAAGEATVTALASPHDVSLPAVSRHLKVLTDAGLVAVEPDGRVRRVRLDPMPLSAAFGWLTRYRVFWEERLDDLARLVEASDDEPETKGTRKERRSRT